MIFELFKKVCTAEAKEFNLYYKEKQDELKHLQNNYSDLDKAIELYEYYNIEKSLQQHITNKYNGIETVDDLYDAFIHSYYNYRYNFLFNDSFISSQLASMKRYFDLEREFVQLGNNILNLKEYISSIKHINEEYIINSALYAMQEIISKNPRINFLDHILLIRNTNIEFPHTIEVDEKLCDWRLVSMFKHIFNTELISTDRNKLYKPAIRNY